MKLAHYTASFVMTIAMLCLLLGCSRIPTREFASYTSAFERVRAVGEEVLLDYALQLEAHEELERRAGSANRERDAEASDRFHFDVAELTDPSSAPDDVGVRLRAWQVLGQYNEALAAVAQGRSADEIAASVDGLIHTLRTFPSRTVVDAALQVTPFAGAAKLALEVIEREAAARRFAQAVRAAQPAIERFLVLLEDDAQNFYNIRKGLHDLAVDERSDRMNDLARTVARIAAEFRIPVEQGADADHGTVHEIINQINETYSAIPDWPQDGLLPSLAAKASGNEYTKLAHSQLEQLADEIERHAEKTRALDDQLLAYREVMTLYVKSIRQTRQALLELALPQRQQRTAQTIAGELFAAAMQLKRAINDYKQAR